jgi:hypothetical protein
MRAFLIAALITFTQVAFAQNEQAAKVVSVSASDFTAGASVPHVPVTSTLSSASEGLGGVKQDKDSSDQKDELSDTPRLISLSGWLYKLIGDPIALFTLVLAIFTYLLWRSTDKLWIEAKAAGITAEKSANAAREAAEIAKKNANALMVSERAWLTSVEITTARFTDSIIKGEEGKHSGWMFSTRWVNAGKTPAVNVLISMNSVAVPVDHDIPVFVPGIADAQGQAPIFPGSSVSSVRRPFKDQDISNLMARKCRIFLYSRADYTDTFNTELARCTELCVEVVYGGTVGKDQIVFQFIAIGQQNLAT